MRRPRPASFRSPTGCVALLTLAFTPALPDAARRTAEHLLAIVHPPFVRTAPAPRGISSPRKRTARSATNSSTSSAANAPSSSAAPPPKTPLSGLANYTGDGIRMEPKFSPDTAAARRADTAAERPGMKAFDDADLPGYAVVTVDGPRVTAKIFPGLSRRPWRPVALSALQTRTV